MSTHSKADALNRGRAGRRPRGSAVPLPDTDAPADSPAKPRGRAGYRKVSLELPEADHDRLKLWVLTAFGGGVPVAPVLRALLDEAYADPALTDRIRRRLVPPG